MSGPGITLSFGSNTVTIDKWLESIGYERTLQVSTERFVNGFGHTFAFKKESVSLYTWSISDAILSLTDSAKLFDIQYESEAAWAANQDGSITVTDSIFEGSNAGSGKVIITDLKSTILRSGATYVSDETLVSVSLTLQEIGTVALLGAAPAPSPPPPPPPPPPS